MDSGRSDRGHTPNRLCCADLFRRDRNLGRRPRPDRRGRMPGARGRMRFLHLRFFRVADESAEQAPGKAAEIVEHCEYGGHENERQHRRHDETAYHRNRHRRAKPPPPPNPKADGNMPAAIAIVVITIGRARLRPASTKACVRGVPRPISSTAKSTSMMAFLVTMPISPGMDIALWVMRSAMIAPPIESGSEMRIVIGCRKLPNNSTRSP